MLLCPQVRLLSHLSFFEGIFGLIFVAFFSVILNFSGLTLIIGVQIMSARYLSRKSGRGILFSPYVEVEICGAEYDNAKFKTKTVNDNGFNPVWNDCFDFQVYNPDLALLRFVIYDVDIFGDSNFIGQYTVPVRCLRSGYRSIPLKNAYSEDLELAGESIFVILFHEKKHIFGRFLHWNILEYLEYFGNFWNILDFFGIHFDSIYCPFMSI